MRTTVRPPEGLDAGRTGSFREKPSSERDGLGNGHRIGLESANCGQPSRLPTLIGLTNVGGCRTLQATRCDSRGRATRSLPLHQNDDEASPLNDTRDHLTNADRIVEVPG